MKLIALTLLLTLTFEVQAAKCDYIVSLSNAVVTVQDSTQVIQQPFVLRRDKGNDKNCDEFRVYFSKGSANSYQRKAVNSIGNTIDYNLHSTITMMGILKQFGDAFSSTEFLQGTAPNVNQNYNSRYFISIPGLTSQNQYDAGTYTDNVQVSFYAVDASNGNLSLADVETFTISIIVATKINISVVDEGASYDASSTSKVLNFGYLSTNQEKAADIRVVSNTPYKIQLSSQNNGSLSNPARNSSISYAMKINGNAVTLAGSQATPVTVGQGNRTSSAGDRYNTKVTITGQTEDKHAGSYEDVITITAIAN